MKTVRRIDLRPPLDWRKLCGILVVVAIGVGVPAGIGVIQYLHADDRTEDKTQLCFNTGGLPFVHNGKFSCLRKGKTT